MVSGKVDRRGGGGADRGDGNRLSTDSVFGHEGRPLVGIEEQSGCWGMGSSGPT